ncbi:DUF6193 family natural product biosynthesis protein [Nonomuraea sp. NEAU-A123]|uniref:DUF6193 family natural product biosynthesis protein n=1 Tax=Nonomuraea sp. NEAU-A123 TaxID=2839649 RepID=UPI001BE487F7|nr:DUF6193 family natural product biosynthesis protein [Nonomuraea sp. NEAU-A123]MBT2234440.1 hypothetical protein [Nonomuraea sp. NEAU-A123]
MELVAATLGLSLGKVLQSDSDPLRWAGIASTTAGREPYSINIGSVERWFIIEAWCQGVRLISGSTPDLAEIARGTDAWRNGARLCEIQREAPFIQVSELAKAHERGPADAVTVKWRLLRESVQESPIQGVLPLVEAAYAEPKLRQLYPFTSHWSLHFTTCTGYPFSWDAPFVDPMGDGRYRVCGPSRGIVIGEADTAEEAIAMVVGGLPADSGPAFADTANDLQRS